MNKFITEVRDLNLGISVRIVSEVLDFLKTDEDYNRNIFNLAG